MLGEEIRNIYSVEFIWIIDGIGWFNAKNNLKETFKSIKYLYTISDFDNGILEDVFRKISYMNNYIDIKKPTIKEKSR